MVTHAEKAEVANWYAGLIQGLKLQQLRIADFFIQKWTFKGNFDLHSSCSNESQRQREGRYY